MTHPPSILHALFATPHGSVHPCPCCGGFELRFRGAAITVSRLGLGELYEAVRQACEADEAAGRWALRVRTPQQFLALALAAADVGELADLLGGAIAMLALDALLVETLGLHLTATT